ncbi:MAG TPA: hypothetical protein VGO93_01485 [Candidatus Xenobia bacterium]
MSADPYLNAVLNQRYRLVEFLGSRRFGRVYRALQLSTQKVHCVRLFSPDDPARERMLEAFESVGRQEIPAVLPWLEVGRASAGTATGHTFLVTAYGQPLGTIDRPIELATAVATALDALHQRKILYLKLSPSNVVQVDGQWFLSDRDTLVPDLSIDELLADTDPYWVAPELWRRDARPEVDAWALGLLVLAAMRDRFPHLGSGWVWELIRGSITPPADLPAPFDLIVRGLLNPVPERRWLPAQVLQTLRGEPVVARTGGKSAYTSAPQPYTRQALSGGQRLDGHGSEVRTLAFSSLGLISGGVDGSLHFWSGPNSRRLALHRAAVRKVAVSPAGGASADASGTIHVWDLLGEVLKTVTMEGPVADLAFARPDDLLILQDDGTLWIWTWKVGKPRLRETLPLASCFVPSGYQNVDWGCLDGHVMHGREGRIKPLYRHGAPVTGVAEDCSTSLDGTVWRRESAPLKTDTELWCVAHRPGRWAAGGHDRLVYLWVGDKLHKLKGHVLGVTSLAFSPDGSHLASGSRDRQIILWDVPGC